MKLVGLCLRAGPAFGAEGPDRQDTSALDFDYSRGEKFGFKMLIHGDAPKRGAVARFALRAASVREAGK